MSADKTAAAVPAHQLRRIRKQHRRDLAALRHELAALRRAQGRCAGETGRSALQAEDYAPRRPEPSTVPAGGTSDLCTFSALGYGLYAASEQGTGIYCRSFGEGEGLSALSERGTGVAAMSLGQADGIYAQSARGNGVRAVGGGALGNGQSPRPAGIFAEGGTGYGIYATGTTGDAVAARSAGGCAIDACSAEGIGVRARCASDTGLALEIEGRIHVRGCAVGVTQVQKGAITLIVPAPAATTESLIVLVPLDDPGEAVRIWVSARGTGTFEISTSAPVHANVQIQYLIIN